MSRSFEVLSVAPSTQEHATEHETAPCRCHLDLRPVPRVPQPPAASMGVGLPATMPESPPVPSSIRRYVRMPAPTSHLLVLQKWEGTVLSLEEGRFTALLRDLTDPTRPDERIDLPFDEIPEGDRDLVDIGAIFYWCIGYRDYVDGQRERVSLIRFQRLPAWTPRELTEARAAAEKLADEVDWR